MSIHPKSNEQSFPIAPDFDDVAVEIVTRVAQLTDASPGDLPPLYDVLDCDALSTMYRHAERQGTTWQTTFEYEDVEVTVGSEGLRLRPHTS